MKSSASDKYGYIKEACLTNKDYLWLCRLMGEYLKGGLVREGALDGNGKEN